MTKIVININDDNIDDRLNIVDRILDGISDATDCELIEMYLSDPEFDLTPEEVANIAIGVGDNVDIEIAHE